MNKMLVIIESEQQVQKVRASGAEVLAEYPNSLLIRATEAQQTDLREAGLELAQVAEAAVNISGGTFTFRSAMEADAAAPVPVDPSRTAYYLVQLVGPAKGEWLNVVESSGASIQGTLPGNVLLVGGTPALVLDLKRHDFVEEVTPYRPTMKVSPRLREGVGRSLTTDDLVTLGTAPAATGDATQQIEVNVFGGESTAAVAAQIRAAGGMVLDTTDRTVTAVVPPAQINTLALEPGVQSILPHRFPKLHNNRALEVMQMPPDATFGSFTLRGASQIVGVADSGLDTGNAATAHQDFAGRINAIQSMPNVFGFASNDPPPFDDGAADTRSAHGTHVAGSVLGNGAAAIAAGSTTIPAGTAPEARLYFQAIEQRVNWKTAAQLIAEGITPPAGWPPPAVGLYGIPNDLGDLFAPAYFAGARIHTNSWGADDAGQYTANSREVDQFLFNNRDMLVLFSAGNEGIDADNSGVIDADSIGSPGTAKNCVTVGASENNRPNGSVPAPGINGNWSALSAGGAPLWPAMGAAGHVSDDPQGMAAFSSRGPTDDGRIKPDLVAPGTNVLSTRSSVHAGPGAPLWGDLAAGDPLAGLYCWSGGTSMSTPLVAGAAALVRQHLVQQRNHNVPGVKPSGALIKAFLVNGAVPMAGQFAGEIPAGPNNVSGFGLADVRNTISPGLLEQALFADEPDYAVSSGEMRAFEVEPLDGAQPLKVTLVWTDAPGLAGTGGLVNQLYLRVRRPDGTFVDGDTVAFASGTAANNVQQVTIPIPAAGTYQIRVHGLSVTQHSPGAPAGPSPRQDFALVTSNVMAFSLEPISLAQSIDTTGSMSFFGYMEPAKERATQLANFLRANDKLSITEFSQRAGLPHARTPLPLRLMGGAADWGAATVAIGGLSANGMTPIGAGLLEAWNQLSGEPAGRPRGIVLLSDGLNNVAPDPMAVLAGIPGDVPIFSVAMGPAGSTPTLQNIAASRPGGAYFTVESDEDVHKLHQIYAAIQALAGGSSLIGLSTFEVSASSGAETAIPVEEGVKEVSFLLSWDGKPAETRFVVTGPDGVVRRSNTYATLERRGATYWLIRVEVPRAGVWKLAVANRAQQRVKYTVSATAEAKLELSATTALLQRRYLSVIANLLLQGKPYDNATLVARITHPTISVQQLLKQHKARLNELRLPQELAERGLNQEQILLVKLAMLGMGFRSRPEGMYGRKTTEIRLTRRGNGVWAGRLPMTVGGNTHIEVIARGRIGRTPWQRTATLGVHTAQAALAAAPTGTRVATAAAES